MTRDDIETAIFHCGKEIDYLRNQQRRVPEYSPEYNRFHYKIKYEESGMDKLNRLLAVTVEDAG